MLAKIFALIIFIATVIISPPESSGGWEYYMFISFDPRQPLHELIRYFKGTSSRILRNKYPELRSRIPSLWTRSYFCCTVGYVSQEAIQKYIKNQKNV